MGATTTFLLLYCAALATLPRTLPAQTGFAEIYAFGHQPDAHAPGGLVLGPDGALYGVGASGGTYATALSSASSRPRAQAARGRKRFSTPSPAKMATASSEATSRLPSSVPTAPSTAPPPARFSSSGLPPLRAAAG